MAMKCCTKLETAKERCPIVFQGHPSNFKVTRDKTSPILTQIGRFWTIGRSQLSNPSDLPCLSATHFTKNMLFTIPVQWKIHIAVMWLPVTRWLQIFPHLTTTELFCYMETFLWSLQNTFPSGLKCVERTISWMVPWHIIWIHHCLDCHCTDSIDGMDGFAQDCSISSDYTLEILQSPGKPLKL